MPTCLQDIVAFRKDKLFNGAVDIDWFYGDQNKAELAAQNFVFHGAQAHAVRQEDIHSSHKLVDTAHFATKLIKRSYGNGDEPFTLAIAGYGTGKSHLALTLSMLFSRPQSSVAKEILTSLERASSEEAQDARAYIDSDERPCLVIPINGMARFDLMSELTKKIITRLQDDNLDITPLDNLRPRFRNAEQILNVSQTNTDLVNELIQKTNLSDFDSIISALRNQDESVYKSIHESLNLRGISIENSTVESIKVLIDTTVKYYCGEGKYYRSLMILFDEFGKYIEFATMKVQIAGYGVLQELFEGIQAHEDVASLVGFIQFELKAYLQRIAPEYKNEILRYITRYESAEKVYLSTNIETLIASLLEKKDAAAWEDKCLKDVTEIELIRQRINQFFPVSQNSTTWINKELFSRIIVKECWPFSPYAMWFLYFLSSAGKFLQDRSTLNLIDEAFRRLQSLPVEKIPANGFPPVSLWSDGLQEELLHAEESGQQGAVVFAYLNIENKYASKLTIDELDILRAIVIYSKLGFVASVKNEAVGGLHYISNINEIEIENILLRLQREYNVIEWDDAAKRFEIIGDSAPRRQFIDFLQKQAKQRYDSSSRAALFAREAQNVCELFKNISTSYGDKHEIYIPEWYFACVTSNTQNISLQIEIAAKSWKNDLKIDKPKGMVFYVYVGQSEDIEDERVRIRKRILSVAKDLHLKNIPVLCVLLYDENGELGQLFSELDILNNLSADEKSKYTNLIPIHREKILSNIKAKSASLIKNRDYVSTIKNQDADDNIPLRLADIASMIFEEIYTASIPFPFDGFNTAKGNANQTCATFVRDLLHDNMSRNTLMSRPAIEKNRGLKLFDESWQVLDNSGVSSVPKCLVLKKIFKQWDTQIKIEPLQAQVLLEELLLPPHGANIASALLVLAVYLSARNSQIFIQDSNRGLTVKEWASYEFQARTLPTPQWGNMLFVPVGDVSEEWQSLLDEWASAEIFSDICSLYQQAQELQKTQQIPPTLRKKYDELVQDSSVAMQKIKFYEERLDIALMKVEHGDKNIFRPMLSGASRLKAILDEMESESSRWSTEEKNKIRNLYGPARLKTAELYPEWKMTEVPHDYSMDAMEQFRSKSRKVLSRLKAIDLDAEYADYDKIYSQKIRNAEQYSNIINNIQAAKVWVGEQKYQISGKTLLELKQQNQIALDYKKSMTKYAEGNISTSKEVLASLEDVLRSINSEDKRLKKLNEDVQNSVFKNPNDARVLLDSVKYLIVKFEGNERDVLDLQDMQKILRECISVYELLWNQHSTKEDFVSFSSELVQAIQEKIEEAELAWEATECFSEYIDSICDREQATSDDWWKQLEYELRGISSMPASDAERLRKKCSNAPIWDAAKRKEKTVSILTQIGQRLEDVQIDWLIERFKGLNKDSRQEFIKKIHELGL